ncbi:MAG: hypothetical protein CO113_11665 [Elusimicrobia bacterium CG_4_9_14_3_um_filter_62_55]|nr:MAG: hypothetical protein COR54_00435 [Elusimicrobia bacterium CG22_combo_CG10-13_8_21_14_all_63_91]PJA15788.1 MAG: hypothetical protein COX66_09175 [Elusimicrobia bacterium CG_4_10_14_0_2_um_filter_63_34]PJB24880.1 MAG: hypothetical protein CO113_11665 [Elusimicrobia bacterium CG_4_9_14_3_um_filter_62_55]
MDEDKRSIEEEIAALQRGLSSDFSSLSRGVSEVGRAGAAREEEVVRRVEMKRLEAELEAKGRELESYKKAQAAEELGAVERRLEARRKELAALEEAEKRAVEAAEKAARVAVENAEKARRRLQVDSAPVENLKKAALEEAAKIKHEAEEAAALLRRESEAAARGLREERERISETLERMMAAIAQKAAPPEPEAKPEPEPVALAPEPEPVVLAPEPEAKVAPPEPLTQPSAQVVVQRAARAAEELPCESDDADEIRARLMRDAGARAQAEQSETEKRDLAKKEKVGHEHRTGDVVRSRRSLSWLYEMPILVGALMALQHYSFPADPSFLSVHPSPLWIPVLMFGLRYGLLSGLTTGLVAAFLYAWGVSQIGEGYRLEDADFLFRPGLYVVVGVGLGIVSDNAARRIAALNGRIVDLLGRVTGLQKQILADQKVLRSVEQQVVSQMSSIVTLFHGSKELGTLERHELLPAILKFFTQALQAEKTSLYVPKDGKWVLFSRSGWSEDEVYPQVIEHAEGVIGRAGAERRVVSVKDLVAVGGFENLRGYGFADAIMAAPICDPEGAPIAVFGVQAMDFLRFNSASVNLLALLAEWGGESVEKCLRVEDLKSRSLFDEEFSVQSVRYFEKQLEQEFRRSVRYALPFSILLVSVEGEAQMPAARRSTTRRIVSRILREAARSTDDVARSPLPEAPFAMLLNTCTREQAQEARDRLMESFAKIEWEEKVKIGVGSYRPEMTAKEELVEQARSQIS